MAYHRWTDRDYRQLARLVQLYGLDWARISQTQFPDVSPVCLKNKYYTRINNNAAYQEKRQDSPEPNCCQLQPHDDIVQKILDILNGKVM
ncbi:Myb-like_DNA-binding domain-containing protein [Hexamita inflata]|uniref:Myb-like DNA-binding domain-containing protein n=1 Tax=Hexamita inflata TaxID=28002 RepID=A0AA86U3B3_9EUKA|nr:Myb-like DNA-binding domain-containing protein [Hexamita inflata]